MRFFDNVLDMADFDADAWADRATLPAGLRAVTLADLSAELGEEAAHRAFYAGWLAAREDVPRTAPRPRSPMRTS